MPDLEDLHDQLEYELCQRDWPEHVCSIGFEERDRQVAIHWM